MHKNPNIVIVGHVCIDENTINGVEQPQKWGSGALFMANYSSTHFGAKPTVITSYGPDFEAVRPGGVSIKPDEPNDVVTLRYENIVSGDERLQYCHEYDRISVPKIGKLALAAADILIVTTLTPDYRPKYIEKVLNHTSPSALRVLCPQGYFREFSDDGRVLPRAFDEAPAIVPRFDLVFLSDQDPPPHNPAKLVQHWARQAENTHIVMTHARDGASIALPHKLLNIPTEKPIANKDVVDSVGAGDTFAMAALMDYYKNRDIVHAVKSGHQAAHDKLLAVPFNPALLKLPITTPLGT